MKKSDCFFVVIFFLIVVSCKKNDIENGLVAPPVPVTESPYDDPVWHPSGNIIGFNHVPIQEISYSNGKQYFWKFNRDSTGFWLINSDGTNMRRVLPYRLNTPAWSPDGKWIAFSNNARQICIMPFDGEKFDTTAIQEISDRGRNFFPVWSPDEKNIAFVQSNCSEVIPCGIWIYSFETPKKDFLVLGTNPAWDKQSCDLFYFNSLFTNGKIIEVDIFKYIIEEKTSTFVTKLLFPYLNNRFLQSSPDGAYLSFISIMENGDGMQLFRMSTNGSNLTKLTSDGCASYSWSPDGEKIVYVNFNDRYIDRTAGSLWIMDKNGNNKEPLTYNDFKIIE